MPIQISDIRPKPVKVRFYKSFLLHGDTAVYPKHRDTVLYHVGDHFTYALSSHLDFYSYANAMHSC